MNVSKWILIPGLTLGIVGIGSFWFFGSGADETSRLDLPNLKASNVQENVDTPAVQPSATPKNKPGRKISKDAPGKSLEVLDLESLELPEAFHGLLSDLPEQLEPRDLGQLAMGLNVIEDLVGRAALEPQTTISTGTMDTYHRAQRLYYRGLRANDALADAEASQRRIDAYQAALEANPDLSEDERSDLKRTILIDRPDEEASDL